MSFNLSLNPEQKALSINLDSKIYGTFAEIGAGQEVARFFFRAGGAAGTIAKTISAYDMVVSDTIYGKEKSGRYVCEDRLAKMLRREYDQLETRLREQRGKDTRFFVFADTVAAKSYKSKGDGHGWLGVRFQHKEGAEPSECVIHVRLLDKDNLQQQEVLGVVGVNLIYSCFNHAESSDTFISSIEERLSTDRIEIDMVRTSGPAFKGVDNRVLSLELVKRNFCKAIMFDSDGSAMQATDELYKKNIMVCRGSFRPPTFVNMDMLDTGLTMFKKDLDKEEHKNIIVLPEISMSKLKDRGNVDTTDFLARVDILAALGHKVLITSFENFFELNNYLEKFSRKNVSFILGVYNLEEIFNFENYKDCALGPIASIGALFGQKTRLYVYPGHDEKNPDEKITISKIRVDPKLTFLIMYLMENGYMVDVENYNVSYSTIWSRTVLKMIQDGTDGWESMVPPLVSKTVKKKCLFGATKCDV
ncbi:TonB-dependent receptor [Halobacteriovorax sp. HLS]|uniref:TonB-dependent receptor n=1 Tax=Halobacteriovorax sp. HLS TaxID=2234000 RepID=UPI000FD7A93B|nr:TonB-dependent receptor [Halobacteriovorax sp. HLS]